MKAKIERVPYPRMNLGWGRGIREAGVSCYYHIGGLHTHTWEEGYGPSDAHEKARVFLEYLARIEPSFTDYYVTVDPSGSVYINTLFDEIKPDTLKQWLTAIREAYKQCFKKEVCPDYYLKDRLYRSLASSRRQ